MRLQAGGKLSIASGSAKEQAAHFSNMQSALSDQSLHIIPVQVSSSSKRKAVPADKDFVVVSNLKTENEVAFIVYGEPTPLQRHRVLRSGITYNPSSNLQKGFLDACRNMLPDTPFEGPLEVKMYFYFKRPLNHYGSGKRSHILKEGMDIWHSKKKGTSFDFYYPTCSVLQNVFTSLSVTIVEPNSIIKLVVVYLIAALFAICGYLDVDNLAKFVLDAINKVAYVDDGQVALLTTAKLYTEAEARVEVSIRKLSDQDAEQSAVPN